MNSLKALQLGSINYSKKKWSKTLLSNKLLASKSLLLSVLLHFIVLFSFILVFPTIPEARKPEMIFLGPILQKHDTINTSEFRYTSKTSSSSLVLSKNDIDSNNTFAITTQEKPPILSKVIKTNKINIKSLFSTSPIRKNKNTELFDNKLNLELHFKDTDYKPLKLY